MDISKLNTVSKDVLVKSQSHKRADSVKWSETDWELWRAFLSMVLMTQRISHCWILGSPSLLSKGRGRLQFSPYLLQQNSPAFTCFLHLGLPWRFCLDRERHRGNGELSVPGIGDETMWSLQIDTWVKLGFSQLWAHDLGSPNSIPRPGLLHLCSKKFELPSTFEGYVRMHTPGHKRTLEQ